MDNDIKTAIVAILNTNHAIVGTGFIAADCLIVTCAHVIEAAQAAPGGHVRVRFAVDDSERFAEVDPNHYSPKDAQDVAILRVSQMPKGVRTLRLAAAENCRPGNPFQSFGYALAADVQGIIARGAIDGYLSKPLSKTYAKLYIDRMLFGSCFRERCLKPGLTCSPYRKGIPLGQA